MLPAGARRRRAAASARSSCSAARVYSAIRFARRRTPGTGPLAGGNALIALGHARAVERRIAAGRRRSGRGVRDLARGRDRRDLRGLRRRVVGTAARGGRGRDGARCDDESRGARACPRACAATRRRPRRASAACSARAGGPRAAAARPDRASCPARATTNATTVSPVRGCGSPITATSSTSRWLRNASSTSPGNTLKPDTMMTSLARSTSVSQPSASATAMSPVCNQPSTSTASVVGGVVPVAREDVRRRARRARRDRPRARVAVAVERAATSTPGQRRADRTGARLGRDRGRRHDGRRLGEAVAVVHRDAEAFVHRGARCRSAASSRPRRTAARAANASRGRGGVVEAEPGVVDRGDAGDDGDAVVADACERLDGMEVVDERDGRARVQREAEHDVQAVDVEEREHAERDVVGGRRAGPGATASARCSRAASRA